MKKVFCLILSLFLCAGCASLHPNPPIKQVKDPAGYSFNNFLAQGNTLDDNLVVLTFSGGGTRAGALAYGVAKYLDTVKLPSGESLLDETKVISSVSGGSFASAYYGLYGKEKFLKDYPQDVLYQNLASQLLRNLFRFVRWIPIAFSGDAGKSELAQALYDKKIFKYKKFSDMPRKWPFIVINATDMTRGSPFSFIQEDFDVVCSDLNQLPISRAVVSSSAFPGPFTPLTFKNYKKSKCGYELPDWAQKALSEHPDNNFQNYIWAQNLQSYMDSSKRKYIHVFDGGVSDNLGLRPILYHFRTGDWAVLDENKSMKAKRVIVVVVNAKPSDSADADQSSKVPKLLKVLMNAATKPMGNYTNKTVEEFILRFQETKKAGENYARFTELCDKTYSAESDRQKCYSEFQMPFGAVQKPPYAEPYLVHVQFDAVRDPELRAKVNKIGTDLQLPKDQVDLLIRSAEEILENSPEFQRLVKDLNATIKR